MNLYFFNVCTQIYTILLSFRVVFEGQSISTYLHPKSKQNCNKTHTVHLHLIVHGLTTLPLFI